MIGIEWHVRELEAPVRARGCLAVKTAHRVRDLHIGVCYCASGRILHHSFNRAGISQLRSVRRCTKQEAETENKKPNSLKTHLNFSSGPAVGRCAFAIVGVTAWKNGG